MFCCFTEFSKSNDYQAYVRFLNNTKPIKKTSVALWWKILKPKMFADSCENNREEIVIGI